MTAKIQTEIAQRYRLQTLLLSAPAGKRTQFCSTSKKKYKKKNKTMLHIPVTEQFTPPKRFTFLGSAHVLLPLQKVSIRIVF